MKSENYRQNLIKIIINDHLSGGEPEEFAAHLLRVGCPGLEKYSLEELEEEVFFKFDEDLSEIGVDSLEKAKFSNKSFAAWAQERVS